jgi:radical SAM superfamily enzyme YgiQ (UPF0313 family)
LNAPRRDVVDRRVWLADLTHTGRGPAVDTVPLGIGFLASYAVASLELAEPISLFRYPESLALALESRGAPDVIGFATYVWNSRLSRLFARQIRAKFPATVVVFGGPNFPLGEAQQRQFLQKAPEIDMFIEHEGEVAFRELLRILQESDWDARSLTGKVPSAHSLDENGCIRKGRPAERLVALDDIPSPYLTGLMDEFLDGYLVPTIQTNRGCPFSCTFCLEGDSYYNRVRFFGVERVIKELEYIALRMIREPAVNGRNELLITDSNFAMFDQDEAICAAIGSCKERYGWPMHVNVTTGKNRRDRVLRSIRRAAGTIQLSGAVQSLDTEVLDNVMRRAIRTDDLVAVALDAASSATRTYSDVILGLPGDTAEAHISTIRTLIDAGFGRINTFQFALLPGAPGNTIEERERFGLVTRYRAIPRGFGRYNVLGSTFISVEVDEICVASNTMTFSDYLKCRTFDLATFIFHNDEILAATEAALQVVHVSLGSWLNVIFSMEWPGRLRAITDSFVRDTAAQLFESASETEDHVSAHADEYLRGECGNNLLYSYRARIIQEALGELVTLGREAALACLVKPDARVIELLTDAAAFDQLSLTRVFSLDSITYDPSRLFSFDIPTLVQKRSMCNIDSIRWEQPRRIRFVRANQVERLVDTYARTMGNTIDGLGRALSRTPVEIFRSQAIVSYDN